MDVLPLAPCGSVWWTFAFKYWSKFASSVVLLWSSVKWDSGLNVNTSSAHALASFDAAVGAVCFVSVLFTIAACFFATLGGADLVFLAVCWLRIVSSTLRVPSFSWAGAQAMPRRAVSQAHRRDRETLPFDVIRRVPPNTQKPWHRLQAHLHSTRKSCHHFACETPHP